MTQKSARPIYLDLRRIKLPVTALTSILHRISGVLMFLSLPFIVYLLDLSLRSAEGYARAGAILDTALIKIALFVLIWSLLHHLLAGIRYLLIDFDIGVRIDQARQSARLVIGAGVAAAVVLGVMVL